MGVLVPSRAAGRGRRLWFRAGPKSHDIRMRPQRLLLKARGYGYAVQGHPQHGGTERPMRELHKSRRDRVGNAVVSVLARAGIGPFWLLTTRGRKTGRTYTNPVTLVEENERRWLVAPYGAVSWVHNARAAGRVTIRRGRGRHTAPS